MAFTIEDDWARYYHNLIFLSKVKWSPPMLIRVASVVAVTLFTLVSLAAAQSVSGIRAFGGGVAPLFGLVGPGNLYLDAQGTQGYVYNFGNNFESFSFRNPSTGQAWSGAMMTLGPQLSIGLIQGANQVGTPLVMPPIPRDVTPPPPIQSTILDEIP
jgi:hypothetical protein